MPCYDERSSADYRLSEVLKVRHAERDELKEAKELAAEMKNRLDELTDISCKLMARLEKYTSRHDGEELFKHITTTKSRKWWKEHKEADARRKQRR
jgi:hypothetical protein